MSEFEQKLQAFRENLNNFRQADSNPYCTGNGGRWSDIMKYAENQFEDKGPAVCKCGNWVPCRHCEEV